MNKLQLYLYPSAAPMLHDSILWYRNTVPFCQEGIEKWCDLVGPRRCEFFHMGMVREFDAAPFPTWKFWEFSARPGKHIVDLEGDYVEGTFREEFRGAIRVASGAPHRWSGAGTIFPRPCMSRMMMEFWKDKTVALPPAKEPAMGFVGKRERYGVRQKLVSQLQGLGIPAHFAVNDDWNSPSEPNAPSRQVYLNNMRDCSVALCPQGVGVNTSRFYEACCLGRFPVIIGQTLIPGEDLFDRSFVREIDSKLEPDRLRDELVEVAQMPLSEMQERGRAARGYWEKVIAPYLDDPTLSFIQWLERQGLRDGVPEEAQ